MAVRRGATRWWFGGAALSALVLLGCGDDVGVQPDAMVRDAAPDADGCFKRRWCYEEHEGGEVRVEHRRFAAGNAAARVSGFLYGDPGTQKLFDYVNLNGCTDVRTKTLWPVATNPIEERAYLDPGGLVIAGGPAALEVPRQSVLGADPMGRVHPANAWFLHDLGESANDAATYLAGDTRYDVRIVGSASVPAQTFEDVLYLPAELELLSPGVEPYALTAGMPHTFTWSTPAAPSALSVSSALIFTGANGPAVLCFEPVDGSLTVPAQMIDIVRAAYPDGGVLERQTIVVTIRKVRDEALQIERRIDFIGVTGYATTFTVN